MHIIPQLRDLEKRFGNGLVVIGVHSPKFNTERDDADVKAAVARYHLDHPVVNDSRMSLWRILGIQAWPTVVLIDPDGYAIGKVEGEGVESQVLPTMQALAKAYAAAGRLNTQPLSAIVNVTRTSPALLSFPGKLTVDPAGKRIFVSDSGHNRILVISPEGKIQQVIGSGHFGRLDGAIATASFRNPQGLALVGHTLYVADTDNHLIRAVDLARGVVSTVAGTGRQEQYPEAGGPALRQPISSPWGLCWLRDALYIAMAGDHRIWRYDPTGAYVGPNAGSGMEDRKDGTLTGSAFAQPSGITTDGRYLYVADSESSSIRRIAPDTGMVSTLAGGDLFDFGHQDAVGLNARFQHPLGIAYLGGKLYIADTYNSDIRALDLASDGVTTLAGINRAGNADGHPGAFFEPGGIAIWNGQLLVADTNNGAIRIVNAASGATSTLKVTGPAA